MRFFLTLAAVLFISGAAHANGKSVRDFQQWCREAVETFERGAPWTNGARRCLNYIHGARDLAAGVSGRSPICYRMADDRGNTLIYEFLAWSEDFPEHADKHIAYGVMATLMENHRCR